MVVRNVGLRDTGNFIRDKIAQLLDHQSRLRNVNLMNFIKRLRRATFHKVVRWFLEIPSRFIWNKILQCMKLHYGLSPVPPWVLSVIHRSGRILTGNSSPLLPPMEEKNLNNEDILDDEVKIALRDQVLTLWNVDAKSLNWIVSYIRENKVKHVLEFGSGLSTVALSITCRRNIENQDATMEPYIVSIEQNAEYAEKTRQLLADLQLCHLAVVIHCPLVDRRLDGHVFKGYEWHIKNMPYLKSGWCADMLFVDGPASGGLSRALAAIEGLQCGFKDCKILMDDGLRDDEIRSMRYLQERKHVTFEGVIPIGTGIALSVRC